MIGISIWDIDMGYRYGISDINGISIWVSIWNMGYRYGIWVIDMIIHRIDMVILDIDMGYGISIWEMTVSILSSWISIWDILSLRPAVEAGVSPEVTATAWAVAKM